MARLSSIRQRISCWGMLSSHLMITKLNYCRYTFCIYHHLSPEIRHTYNLGLDLPVICLHIYAQRVPFLPPSPTSGKRERQFYQQSHSYIYGIYILMQISCKVFNSRGEKFVSDALAFRYLGNGSPDLSAIYRKLMETTLST